MEITLTFGIALIVALVGVIPPGLLNMTAAKISIKDGHTRGLVFSLGVCIVVIVQTLIALVFARYLSSHPNVVDILQRVAFVLFVLITIYFLVIAKKTDKPNVDSNVTSKKSRFFQGLLLSALNVFPIPYQAYMAITFTSFKWIKLNPTGIAAYVAGAATGTFVMLYIYVFFFERINSKKIKSQKGMNFIIGIITGIISIITFINIVKEW
ncbi:threonine/homoserine/homoserine lactone efflux protein [Lacinutrix venerupis]|uniref:LysE family transporter n=1 Tax=Lacinutrix venerupis TaxID=1486034 RepID=UPI000EAC6D63|nr:LysE family transporter [Lacinutrix venerupis]RLJ65649.1 threonine/homoserine/homoserine lactone efflux protein [Lacinutrix venerupis]